MRLYEIIVSSFIGVALLVVASLFAIALTGFGF